MGFFTRCVFGPKLYRIYRTNNRQGYDYQGNVLENYSDNIVRTTVFSLTMAWSVGLYSSPIIASFMYRKGYFTPEGILSLFRLSGTVGILIFFTMVLRGIGRMMSNDYITFVSVLDNYKQNMSKNLKSEMSHYDFDFQEWPVDFQWNESSIDESKPRRYLEKSSSRRSGVVESVKSLPCGVLSYLTMHTFGRMMIYPGSVGLLNLFLAPMLLKGRSKLIEDYYAERFKLLTRDGNTIDSIFVDRRNKSSFPNGNTLIVCCEGNTGFYESGVTLTPIDAGYSVLGWNHPGFAFSTGTPYPDQDLNAMDVVMQFAINKLGFKIENIVIYAWSIGGFSASWCAMNYPDIKGLVLDATFDDLVALALARMPPSWKPLVVRTIRDYMDLNNGEQLKRYSGPVLLIRRSKDEIISTSPSRSLQTNRGNDLLIKVMKSRFPKLVTEETVWLLKEWLSGDKNHQTILWTQQGVESELCEASITSYIEENSPSFPMHIGDNLPIDMKLQLLLYLADKYMIDFDSSHCIQLPSRLFQLPWDITYGARNQSSFTTKSQI